MYKIAKQLAEILKSSVDKSTHHVNNTQNFVEHIKGITLGTGEYITSYDVRALFISVPVEPGIEVIKHRLEQGISSGKSNNVSTNIIELPRFYLHNHIFLIPGTVLQADRGGTNGVLNQSNSCQFIHGLLWIQSLSNHKEPSPIVEKICGWHLCHTKKRI